MRAKFSASILHDSRGTTIIEFAVVAPVFLMVLFATLELGLFTFTQMSLEMAVAEAGRNVSISTTAAPGYDRVAAFKAEIQQRTKSLINGSNVQVSANVVTSGGGGGVSKNPDICLLPGVAPSSPATCPNGTPFIDNNGNGKYDGPGNLSLGAAGNEVELRVSLPWKIQFPFVKFLFTANDSNGNAVQGIAMASATTVIKNE